MKTKSHPKVLVARRLRPLLKIFIPNLIVARVGNGRNKDLQAVFRQIKREVGGILFLPMRSSHGRYVGQSKYERAVKVAARFPEINWKLPSKRKPWESEHYSMSIFEALAAAVAHTVNQ